MKTIDTILGERIRHRRLELGMTQSDLAQKIEVRFQQVQKYERGANRVGASRLFELAKALGVPVSYFFDDMPAEGGAGPSTAPTGQTDEDPMRRRETVELVRTYYRIPDETARRRLYELMRSIAGSMDGDKP